MTSLKTYEKKRSRSVDNVIPLLYYVTPQSRQNLRMHSPLLTAREMRWRRNIADRASKFTAVILRPSSRTSSNPFSPHAPDVSIAIGTKSIPAGKSEYLAIIFSSAIFAAEPLDAWMCEIAKVSGQVASQTRHRPFFQGTVVIPSGRFPVTPALVHSLVGSRVARTSALRNARCIIAVDLTVTWSSTGTFLAWEAMVAIRCQHGTI